MSTTPAEDLVMGLKTRTTSGLLTYLAAIETEKADGISLPDLAAREYGYREVFGRGAYPFGAFVPGDIEIEASANGADMLVVNAAVLFAITDNNPETLAKKLLRYVDAFRAMVAADETIGGTCIIAQINSIEVYPAAQGAKDMAVAVVNVKMTTEVVT